VAGTIGGNVYGVAKNVLLIAVKVLDDSGSGTTAGVVAGMDWVAINRIKPAVANMSLGGGASTAIDDAVGRMYDAGVPVIVAAGNGNWIGRADDACKYSPARAPKAYTIGATTSTDAKASYSNYGNCVNLFALGSSITSAWHTNNTATNTISGTSMATPHVVGGAALFLENNPGATAQQVYDALTEASTKGVVINSKTTNNHLLYTLGFGSGGGEDPPPAENVAPTASFTYTINDLTASFNASGSSDSDGTVVSYSWNFGDGTTGSGVTASRTYASAGTYTVTLTVKDDEGATGTQSQSVTVTAPPPGGDNLPVIDSFSLTTGNAGPWRRAFVDWAVSDQDSDLALVSLELLAGSDVLQTVDINVSGGSASGSNELRSRTAPTDVRITVTDGNGNSATQLIPY
jgi:subtilisin family serine protease